MLAGKRFKLKERTLAVEVLHNERRAVSIPVGVIFEVVSGFSDGEQTVDVLWEGRSAAPSSCDYHKKRELPRSSYPSDFGRQLV